MQVQHLSTESMETDWIAKWARYSPSKTVVTDNHTQSELTYSQLDNLANYLGQKLTTLGIEKGDRVVILAEFRIELVVLFAVALKKGIILVPLNYRLSTREIDHLLGDSSPSAIFFEQQFRHLLDTGLQSTSIDHLFDLDVLSSELDIISNQIFSGENVEMDERDPLFILYTSGTTGFPKGAIYTYKMAFWNAINTQLRLDITSEDRTIICMPPFHTGGWNVLLVPFLFQGASFMLVRKFDAFQVLGLLEEQKTTIFMGVPTMLKMMADSSNFHNVSLHELRYMVVGGEAMPLPLIETWERKGIPIRQGFGLTEVGPNIFSLHQDDAIRKIGSIGTPNFYVDVRLVKSDGKDALENEEGELWLRSPTSTPGYWQNSAATEEAFVQDWFRTGDVLVKDSDGYYYVKDRIKNMFISGGENVYPTEVEKFLQTHASISEVAVIGVADDKWGEVGKAFVVCSHEKFLSEESILDFCAGNLAKFKIPKHYVFLEELPKNATGKIDRKKLRNLLI